jgi:hypothetical protein
MKPRKHSAILIQKSAERTPLLIATGTKGRKIPKAANNQSFACMVEVNVCDRLAQSTAGNGRGDQKLVLELQKTEQLAPPSFYTAKPVPDPSVNRVWRITPDRAARTPYSCSAIFDGVSDLRAATRPSSMECRSSSLCCLAFLLSGSWYSCLAKTPTRFRISDVLTLCGTC